jgi:glycosyltransferase involved in cell wall biosynthesis
MATYTGVNTVGTALNSLLRQKLPGADYELIVVIDGPNQILRHKIDSFEKKFINKGVKFRVEQFKQNRGRFEARLVGAELAKNKYLIITDDRVEVPSHYFKYVASSGRDVIIPDVTENPPKNFVSLTLAKLRGLIYGKNWNSSFKSYYIDNKNFDKSAKGTACLWISTDKFIEACQNVAGEQRDLRNINEDTRILKFVVDSGTKIYKASEIKLVYEPRSGALEELYHMYKRAPRFIDYYFHFGNRYFPLLLAFYVLIIPVISAVIIYPSIALAGFLVYISLCLLVSRSVKQWPRVIAGIGLIFLFFGAGLIVALTQKVFRDIVE